MSQSRDEPDIFSGGGSAAVRTKTPYPGAPEMLPPGGSLNHPEMVDPA
jgi:hypothetical protein